MSHRILPLHEEIDFYDEGNINSFQSAVINAFKRINNNTTKVKDYSMTVRVHKILQLFK